MRHHAEELLQTIPGVDTSPIRLTLGQWGAVVIHRPALRDYLRYEAEWAGLIGGFIPLFHGVGFLSVEELADLSVRARFVRELIRAIQDERFLRCLRWFVKRWTRRWSLTRAIVHKNGWTGIIQWPEGIDGRNFDRRLTYSQICEVLTLFHQLIVTEKKNTKEVAVAMGVGLKGYSISAPPSGGGPRPRFGKPKP